MRKINNKSAAPAKSTKQPVSSNKSKKSDKTKSTDKTKSDSLNAIEQSILAALNAYALRDDAFAIKWQNGKGKKSIHDVFHYLLEYHRPGTRKNGDCAATNNDDDHQLAIDFIMDDSKKVPTPPANAKPQNSKSKADVDDDDDTDEVETAAPSQTAPKKPRSAKVKQPKADPTPSMFDDFDLW